MRCDAVVEHSKEGQQVPPQPEAIPWLCFQCKVSETTQQSVEAVAGSVERMGLDPLIARFGVEDEEKPVEGEKPGVAQRDNRWFVLTQSIGPISHVSQK